MLIRTLFFSLLFVFLPGMPAFAQETPVGVSGNQVSTEATPAAAANAEELRKQSQNPIANLISVPLQENFNFGIGPADRTQNVLNIQPVIPFSLGKKWNLITRWIMRFHFFPKLNGITGWMFSLGKKWNLITRWIMPIIYQPLPVPQPPGPPSQQTGVYGLGDMNPSFFLSPKVSKVIWGVGTTLVAPTATNTTYLGQGKFSIGPSVVALIQPEIGRISSRRCHQGR